jgi:hypothetical protein
VWCSVAQLVSNECTHTYATLPLAFFGGPPDSGLGELEEAVTPLPPEADPIRVNVCGMGRGEVYKLGTVPDWLSGTNVLGMGMGEVRQLGTVPDWLSGITSVAGFGNVLFKASGWLWDGWRAGGVFSGLGGEWDGIDWNASIPDAIGWPYAFPISCCDNRNPFQTYLGSGGVWNSRSDHRACGRGRGARVLGNTVRRDRNVLFVED